MILPTVKYNICYLKFKYSIEADICWLHNTHVIPVVFSSFFYILFIFCSFTDSIYNFANSTICASLTHTIIFPYVTIDGWLNSQYSACNGRGWEMSYKPIHIPIVAIYWHMQCALHLCIQWLLSLACLQSVDAFSRSISAEYMTWFYE